MNQFEEIFKKLPVEVFRNDPRTIMSYMMDYGFDRRHVKMLKTVIEDDLKEFNEFLDSDSDSDVSIIDAMAEYCLVSRDALSEIMHGIKDSLEAKDVPTIVENYNGHKYYVSDDGMSMYSEDLEILLRVNDVGSFIIPRFVKHIGRRAFVGCSFLKEIIIPDSVTSIGASAFCHCSSLIEVVIPDSVTSIGNRAFRDCSSLKEIVIPDSVTSIGASVFRGCTSLKKQSKQ